MTALTLADPAFLARAIPSGPPYNPLTAIPWADAYWSEDPSWTNPGDGNGVASWRDAGTRALNLAQATGANQPLFRATGLNGWPSLQFDGSNDFMISSTGSAISQPYTQVLIGSFQGTGSRQRIAPIGTSTATTGLTVNAAGVWVIAYGGAIASVASVATGGHLFLGFANGVSSAIEVDGANLASGDAGSTAVNAIRFSGASAGSDAFNGHAAFYGVIGRALTSGEKADLLAWSQSHYGTP